MSKLIVEMKMPKNCPCELSAEVFDPSGNYYGYQPCFAWYGIPARSTEFDRCVVRSERPDWCPIVGELPEEHGDLIDRDELKRHKRHSEELCENIVSVAQIDWMPTIVPATERSET